MNDDDEFPRLHGQAIDPTVLAGEGEPFIDLVTRHGGDPLPVPQPNGWRVLRQRGDAVEIGAPLDADRRLWLLASVRPGEEVWLLEKPEPVRASYAERRRGLILRWPAAVRADAGPDGFAIDIVNTGEVRWEPDGDSFDVIGTVAAVDDGSVSMGWATMGERGAVPLDPGDYARVPVRIDESAWARLTPGEHELHALLVPLAVRSEPLRIDVAPHTVNVAQMSERSRDGGRRRQAMHDDLRQQQAILDAAPRLADIVAAVGPTQTEEDAVAAIGHLLSVDSVGAEAVFAASLSDLHPSSAEWRRERIAHTERSLERSGAGLGKA
ncbi:MULTISPECIES: hypothetical protein [unclassified Microbacterium]|uniref:hypothetical protein n=1 Tax=unclassified Microbacterium TaxID=2609290 RepID=UPI00386338E9